MMDQNVIDFDAAIPRLAPLAPKPHEQQNTHADIRRQMITKTATNDSGVRRKKTSSISAEEWEAKKTEIHQLYLTRDLPLPEVMKIMEQQNSFVQSCVHSVIDIAFRSLQAVAAESSTIRSSSNGDLRKTSKVET